MVKFKLDLHTHTSDFRHFILSEKDKKSYLIKLLNKLYRHGDNIVIGVAEFNDDGRFSRFIEAIKLLPEEYKINKNLPIVSIEKKNKTIYFIRADEIATEKGHILIIGNNQKINSRKLKNVLKKAKKNEWIVIVDHPLHELSLPYFLIAKLIEPELLVSLQKETILKNKESIDSLELNSYLPEDRKKIKKFAKKNKIPIIADSDAHSIEEFFDSYFELENLDLRNITMFKKSFRKALRKKIKVNAGKHEFIAKYNHGLKVLLVSLGVKLGIIKY